MADTTKTPFAHAPASRLVGAYLIDLLILGVLLGVTWYVHFTAWTIGMVTAEAVVASALMLGASGRTPGMALMRVCLIRDEDDAQTPSLGAALATVAVAIRQELVFALMSGIFVVEALSVMIQVGSYKWRGKRVFRMAPLHHHFELCGWPESRVTIRFWIITVILVLIGLSTLKLR